MTDNNFSRCANEIDAIVGANLRRHRTAQKMSQDMLGRQVGVSFQQIQKYERGTNRIGASRLWQFTQIFGITPSCFFENIDHTETSNSNGSMTDTRLAS